MATADVLGENRERVSDIVISFLVLLELITHARLQWHYLKDIFSLIRGDPTFYLLSSVAVVSKSARIRICLVRRGGAAWHDWN